MGLARDQDVLSAILAVTQKEDAVDKTPEQRINYPEPGDWVRTTRDIEDRSDLKVGDEIVIQINEGWRSLIRSGVVTKVLYTPPPGWSDKLTGYTLIQYRDTEGAIQVVSDPHPGLRRKTALDKLVEGLE